MKKFKLLLLIISLMFCQNLLAQSGWQTSAYYAEQGETDIVCGNPYSVLTGYDYYGRPIYTLFQDCRQRNWYSWYGRRGGYFWSCNGYNCFWEFKTEERTWWYFTWYNFTRRY